MGETSRRGALRAAVSRTVDELLGKGKRRRRASAKPGSGFVFESLEQRQLLSGSLVAWYKYDDASGLTAVDSSGNGENGTLTSSGATWTTNSRIGTGAIQFNGYGYVTSSDADLPMGDSARTLALWVNTTNLGTNSVYGLAGWGTAATNEAFGLQVAYVSGNYYLKFAAYNNTFTGSIALTKSAWNHVAVTFDGTTAALYVNGVADTSESESLSTTGGKLYSGSFINVYNDPCQIDDLRVYNTALTASQVAALASPPAAPVVTAVSTDGQVALSWAAVSGASSYNIYRSLTSDGEGGTPYQTGVTSTSFTDTGLTDGTRYYYMVTAVSSTSGESAPSTQVSGWPHTASTPVAWYKYDDGSGSTAADSSGNGETGTLVAGPTWTTNARVGSDAIQFNGYSYVTSSDADLPMGDSARTLALWYNTTGLGNNATYGLGGWGSSVAGAAFGLSLVKVSGNWVLQFSDDGATLNGSIALTNNAWNHLAVTFNGSTITLYVNGQQDSSGSFTLNTAGGTFTTGKFLSNGDPGTMDDVRVYDRALSAAEIAEFVTAPALTVLSGNGENVLDWASVVGATTYNVYRSTTSGGEGTTPYATGITGNSFVDTSVTAGTTYYYTLTAVTGVGEGLPSTERSAAPGSLPSGWSDTDIGSPTLAGAATSSSGTWSVTGSGNDIFGTSDQLHYAYTSLTGVGEIIAEVNSQQNTGTYSKAGIMFRAGTAANAAWVMLSQNDDQISFQYRSAAGQSAASVGSAGDYGVSNPIWLKLSRIGNVFTAYTSTDGNTWTNIGSITLSLSTTLDVGLAVDAYSTTATNTAVFNNVSFAPGTPIPDAPTTVTATALSETAAQITWNDSLGATGYAIYRSDNGSAPALVGTVGSGATSYVDTGLTASDNAQYTVYATNATGSSSSSAASSTTTDASGSDSVWLVTLGSGTAGSTDNSDTDNLTASAYPVEAANAQDAIALAVSGSATCNDAGSGLGTQVYQFAVGNNGETGRQNSAFVVEQTDTSPDRQPYNDGTQGGLTTTDDGLYTGYIGLEDLYGYPSSSDNDYNDRFWAVSVQELSLNSMTVTDDNETGNAATADSPGETPTLAASTDADGNMDIDITADAAPTSEAYAQLGYEILGLDGTVYQSGQLGENGMDVTGLSTGNYVVETGFVGANGNFLGAPLAVNVATQIINLQADPTDIKQATAGSTYPITMKAVDQNGDVVPLVGNQFTISSAHIMNTGIAVAGFSLGPAGPVSGNNFNESVNLNIGAAVPAGTSYILSITIVGKQNQTIAATLEVDM